MGPPGPMPGGSAAKGEVTAGCAAAGGHTSWGGVRGLAGRHSREAVKQTGRAAGGHREEVNHCKEA